MPRIIDFDDALDSFRRFLREEGHSTNILWVFREDIWKQPPARVVLTLPSQKKNLALSRKVFEEGRGKGLVEIHAIASVGDEVAATVWFPKFTGEEVQGWSGGLKLSIARPLPEGEVVGHLRWSWFRLRPQFRHYQRVETSVGTKTWAAREAETIQD